jgi:hypothetical protein
MDKVLKSGLIAGLAGMPFMVASIVLFLYYLRIEPVSSRDFTHTINVLLCVSAFAFAFLVSGVLSGILAFRSVKSAWSAFVPGLIAGFVVGFLPLVVFLFSVFFFIFTWLAEGLIPGLWGNLVNWSSWLLLVLVGIGMAGVCSALTISFVYFRRTFYPADPKPSSKGDLVSLDMLYSELLEDARTLIADMNQSIAVYRIAGLFIVISGIVLLAFAIAGWLKVLGGWYSFYDFIFTTAATLCGLVQIATGPYLLYWYDKLRKRYANLAHMEKASGD